MTEVDGLAVSKEAGNVWDWINFSFFVGWGYHRRRRLSVQQIHSWWIYTCYCNYVINAVWKNCQLTPAHVISISEKTKCLWLKICCIRSQQKKRGSTSSRGLSSIQTATSWTSNVLAAIGKRILIYLLITSSLKSMNPIRKA